MKTLMFTVFIIAAGSPAFPNGEPETFDEMVSSLLSGSVNLIAQEELQSMIDSGKDLYIIDSRTPDEYTTSRLKNAVLADFENFTPAELSNIPKSSVIIVYCSVGYRSEKTGEKLLDSGYTNVYNLNGGIFRWLNEGRKIFNASGETSKIHGFSEDWSKWLKNGEVIY